MSRLRRLTVAAAAVEALAATGLAGAAAAQARDTDLLGCITAERGPEPVWRLHRSAEHGRLQAGSILVSDFNSTTDGGNLQGTGRTIVQITPGGQLSVFATIDPASCLVHVPVASA